MASIERTAGGRWRARWREYSNAPPRSRTFDRRSDAQRFITETEHRLLSGTYTAPSAGQTTVAELAEEWVQRRQWAPSTVERVRRELDRYVLPAFGARPVASIRRAHVEEWVRSLQMAPSSAGPVLRTLTGLLAFAVDDERIAKNPAKGVEPPRVDRAPFELLTLDQVRSIAANADPIGRAAIATTIGTGLRQGELFGLTVDRIDFLRRRLRVGQQLWTPDRGPAVLRPPKSKRSYRTVALSGLVLEVLAAHLASYGPGDDGLVFHHRGLPIVRTAGWRMIAQPAKRAGLAGRAWHDLRHYHASALLSEGLSPAIVAERLGHDVGTLLRTYAHVIRSDDDRVRATLDRTLGDSAVSWLCPEDVSQSSAVRGHLGERAGQEP